DARSAARCQPPRGAWNHGAVDDGESRAKAVDVGKCGLLELRLRHERNAQMHHADLAIKLDPRQIVAQNRLRALEGGSKRAANLSDSHNQGWFPRERFP